MTSAEDETVVKHTIVCQVLFRINIGKAAAFESCHFVIYSLVLLDC